MTLRRLLLPCLLVAGSGRAATLSVNPPTGNGRAGEVVVIQASGFAPSATLHVTIGGVPVAPQELAADATGALGPTPVLLTGPLPGGRHALQAAGVTVKDAYAVRPLLTIDPPIGDGKAGETWRTNKKLPVGGYRGMVVTVAGTGFPANGFLPADSIRIGKATSLHDPIHLGADGSLPATTLIIGSDLTPGRYDLVVPPVEGIAATFASAYSVAPWAATDTVRQRSAGRTLQTARAELKELVAAAGDILPADDVTDVTADLAAVETELKGGNYDNAEERARQARDKLAALARQAETARKDKMRALADVIAAGFDSIQPPGATPNRNAGATVEKGRATLNDARTAIMAAKFDDAKAKLKAANELLKKARAEAGVKAAEEPIRW